MPSGLAARFRLRAFGGFLVSASRSREDEVFDVTILAPGTDPHADIDLPKVLTFASPWRQDADLPGEVLVNGLPYATTAGGVVAFPVDPGVEYLITHSENSVVSESPRGHAPSCSSIHTDIVLRAARCSLCRLSHCHDMSFMTSPI